MKHNEMEQAVMELCDAVPEFIYKPYPFSSTAVTVGSLSFYVDDELACIAQHAKLYAAQQDWMPYTDFHDGTYSLYLVDVSMEYPIMGRQTKWLEFDPTQLGSEELQWIRAVTEMAQLNTTKEN